MRRIDPSEITPVELYLSRRRFMTGIGALTLGSGALAACRSGDAPTRGIGSADSGGSVPSGTLSGAPQPVAGTVGAATDELGDPLTEYEAVTHYNNYYEFSTDKQAVAPLAAAFATAPWSVQVGGLVAKPQTFDVEALQAFKPEERIYRLRCVEGWSMVIPWIGFPISRLLEAVQPSAAAKYVRFETIHDPQRMSGQNNDWYEWPYVEGLRLDEATNDLAILATGLYGNNLLPQNGAPVRLVVPWKYGFKSIKAIVKIDLVEDQPTSLWMAAAPDEYGFYANVNPDVDHPRWSQASERRIGEFRRRRTLRFNGYEEEVAGLYTGMDLQKQF